MPLLGDRGGELLRARPRRIAGAAGSGWAGAARSAAARGAAPALGSAYSAVLVAEQRRQAAAEAAPLGIGAHQATGALAPQHLAREMEVGARSGAADVVDQHRPAVRGRLGDAHVARDHRLVDLVAEVGAHVAAPPGRRACCACRTWSARCPGSPARGLNARRTRSIVRIRWLMPSSAKNSHCSGTSTASAATSAFRVSRPSDGRAVDQHVVAGAVERRCSARRRIDLAPLLARPARSRRRRDRRRRARCRGPAPRSAASPRPARPRRSARHRRRGGGRPVDAEAGRGVALRIEVDDEHPLADGGEGGGEVDRGRRLADAALLVGDGDDARAACGSARLRRSCSGGEISSILKITASGSERLGNAARSASSRFSSAAVNSAATAAALGKQADAVRCQPLGRHNREARAAAPGAGGDHVGRFRRHRFDPAGCGR